MVERLADDRLSRLTDVRRVRPVRRLLVRGLAATGGRHWRDSQRPSWAPPLAEPCGRAVRWRPCLRPQAIQQALPVQRHWAHRRPAIEMTRWALPGVLHRAPEAA